TASARGPRRDDEGDGSSRFSSLWFQDGRLFKKSLPVGKQTLIAIAVQRPDEFIVLLLLRLAQERHQYIRIGGRKLCLQISERENEHVKVARWASEAPDPRELGREVTNNVGRKHMPDLAEQRTRTSDAHAKVVKKFRVQIRADTWLVSHEEVKQRGMNSAGADISTD